MTKRKMMRLCDKLTKVNADWEASKDNHAGQPRADAHSKGRMAIVGRWMWCALMHLDALGYDVVKSTRKEQ